MRVSECVASSGASSVDAADPIAQLIAGIEIPDSEISSIIGQFYQMMIDKNPALVARFPHIIEDPDYARSLQKDCALTMATAALAAILQKEDDFLRVLDYFFAADRSGAPRNKYSRACCVFVLNKEARRLPTSHPFYQRLPRIERLFTLH
jgi:hypothetical protein